MKRFVHWLGIQNAVIPAWTPESSAMDGNLQFGKSLISCQGQCAGSPPCGLDSGNPCRNDDLSFFVRLPYGTGKQKTREALRLAGFVFLEDSFKACREPESNTA